MTHEMGPANVFGMVELADCTDLLDAHGPETFEELQAEFVERLKRWVRSDDEWQILDRNRFCATLKGVRSQAEIQLAAAKLARLFDEPVATSTSTITLKVNAGFVPLKWGETRTQTTLKQAGAAIKRARRTAHMYEVFDPSTSEVSATDPELIAALEEALQLGEFVLYFQPKVHAGFGNLVGAEALIRWHTSGERVITPDAFMEVAESYPVIRPLSWWIVKSAIGRCARWTQDIGVAVNVPPNLLLDDEIVAVVRDALAVRGLEPGRLTLEVTENVMVDNYEAMFRQLEALRKLGVRIAIDDFGTGYSSLAYFRDLPADELKIDKCFVQPMLESQKDAAIVKAVIDLAHNFSLRVVAEGVEDKQIAARLSELGCDVLQGYAFDRPMPAEEFERRHQLVEGSRTLH